MAGWDPMANQFYSSIFFLLHNSEAHTALSSEVRAEFESCDEITHDRVMGLKYLHACLQETFRFHQNTTDGLPRMSPGAMVDGTYVPRGVSKFRK